MSFFKRLTRSILIQETKRILKTIFKKKVRENPPPSKEGPQNKEPEKIHPWRLCGLGRHSVVDHILTVPVSEKNPSGKTVRDEHCADNPTRKNGKPVQDYMDNREIRAIASNEFANLDGVLPLGALPEFAGSEEFDPYILGWTKYWNDVLKPETLLDPNIVKALIASESGYNLKPKPQNAGVAGKARGFIQLTDQAIKALSDIGKEIKDHYIKITPEETSDPNMSICAGIRWLFHKQKLASNTLGRDATWMEAVENYKGVLNKDSKSKNSQLGPFLTLYEELRGHLEK